MCASNEPLFPLPYIGTKQSLPAERTGLIGIKDELISVGGFQLKGLKLENVAALLREATKKKTGAPLRLRFRRHASATVRTNGEVSRIEIRKGSGETAMEKQKNLAEMSNSKKSSAQIAISSPDAKPDGAKDAQPVSGEDTTAAVKAASIPGNMAHDSPLPDSTSSVKKYPEEKPATKQVAGHFHDANGVHNGDMEYEALLTLDNKFGLGIRLGSDDKGKITVAEFMKNPGE